MKFLRLILLAIFFWIPCATAQQQTAEPSPYAIDIPSWFKESFLDVREDINEATAKHKRLMLYFGQDGCPYCTTLMQDNFGQKDIVDKTRKSFEAIALNIWGDREVTWIDGRTRSEKQLAVFLKVQFTPTLLFFDERGNIVLRVNGLYPPNKFRVALDYVAGKKERLMPFPDYLKSARTELDSGVFHDEDFFTKPPYRLQSGNRPLAVFFEQRHCSACDEMHAKALRDPATQALLKKFKVVRLNLHGRENLILPNGRKSNEAQWAHVLRITYAPSIVLFDSGKEIFRVEAYTKAFHLQSALDYVASRSYLSESSFQRFAKARAEKISESGVTPEVWK